MMQHFFSDFPILILLSPSVNIRTSTGMSSASKSLAILVARSVDDGPAMIEISPFKF